MADASLMVFNKKYIIIIVVIVFGNVLRQSNFNFRYCVDLLNILIVVCSQTCIQ